MNAAIFLLRSVALCPAGQTPGQSLAAFRVPISSLLKLDSETREHIPGISSANNFNPVRDSTLEPTDRIGRRTRLRPITRSYKLIPRRMKGFRELRNYTAFRASNLPPPRNFAVCRTRGEQVRLDEHFACRQCAIR